MSALLCEVGEHAMQNHLLTISGAAAQAIDEARERPRVLHLVTSFEAGGTERQFVELLKRLDRNRYDVRLAALRVEGAFYQEIAAAFPLIPEFRLTSFYNRNAARQLARLRALIKGEGVQIIHTHGFYDSLFGAVAGRLVGIKVIASQRHLQLSERKVHAWGTRAIHRLAHRLIVNSEAIRQTILNSGSVAAADKIRVIHNGLYEADDEASLNENLQAASSQERQRRAHRSLCEELKLSPQVKLIGMVARLVAVKGHQYFLEAASQVAREDERVHFVLIGEGMLRSDIEQQAARLGIAERLHLLGDRKDARRLVAGFDVSVLTSLSEGLPNTVMEAMSVGVPVIATAVGGTSELVNDGETGFLIPHADAEALVERMLFVLRHESESREIAERGRAFINSRFSMRRMVEAVERLYEEMMTSPL